MKTLVYIRITTFINFVNSLILLSSSPFSKNTKVSDSFSKKSLAFVNQNKNLVSDQLPSNLHNVSPATATTDSIQLELPPLPKDSTSNVSTTIYNALLLLHFLQSRNFFYNENRRQHERRTECLSFFPAEFMTVHSRKTFTPFFQRVSFSTIPDRPGSNVERNLTLNENLSSVTDNHVKNISNKLRLKKQINRFKIFHGQIKNGKVTNMRLDSGDHFMFNLKEAGLEEVTPSFEAVDLLRLMLKKTSLMQRNSVGVPTFEAVWNFYEYHISPDKTALRLLKISDFYELIRVVSHHAYELQSELASSSNDPIFSNFFSPFSKIVEVPPPSILGIKLSSKCPFVLSKCLSKLSEDLLETKNYFPENFFGCLVKNAEIKTLEEAKNFISVVETISSRLLNDKLYAKLIIKLSKYSKEPTNIRLHNCFQLYKISRKKILRLLSLNAIIAVHCSIADTINLLAFLKNLDKEEIRLISKSKKIWNLVVWRVHKEKLLQNDPNFTPLQLADDLKTPQCAIKYAETHLKVLKNADYIYPQSPSLEVNPPSTSSNPELDEIQKIYPHISKFARDVVLKSLTQTQRIQSAFTAYSSHSHKSIHSFNTMLHLLFKLGLHSHAHTLLRTKPSSLIINSVTNNIVWNAVKLKNRAVTRNCRSINVSTVLKTWSELDESNTEGHTILAQILLESGRVEIALRELEKRKWLLEDGIVVTSLLVTLIIEGRNNINEARRMFRNIRQSGSVNGTRRWWGEDRSLEIAINAYVVALVRLNVQGASKQLDTMIAKLEPPKNPELFTFWLYHTCKTNIEHALHAFNMFKKIQVPTPYMYSTIIRGLARSHVSAEYAIHIARQLNASTHTFATPTASIGIPTMTRIATESYPPGVNPHLQLPLIISSIRDNQPDAAMQTYRTVLASTTSLKWSLSATDTNPGFEESLHPNYAFFQRVTYMLCSANQVTEALEVWTDMRRLLLVETVEDDPVAREWIPSARQRPLDIAVHRKGHPKYEGLHGMGAEKKLWISIQNHVRLLKLLFRSFNNKISLPNLDGSITDIQTMEYDFGVEIEKLVGWVERIVGQAIDDGGDLMSFKSFLRHVWSLASVSQEREDLFLKELEFRESNRIV